MIDMTVFPEKVQFIIEEYEDIESPDRVPRDRVINRRLSYPVRVDPLVRSPLWYMRQWRDFHGLKRNEHIVGYIPYYERR